MPNKLTPAEQLLAIAQAAPHTGRYQWTPYFEAVRMFRAKGWKWDRIYRELVNLGVAPDGDKKAYTSFRTIMARRIQKAAAKAKLDAKPPKP